MIETIINTSILAARLGNRIRNEGPISFCDWMKTALYDPEDGYYCATDRPKWGREGDYRTSPERSSLFAATFARYFGRLYEHLGRPANWTIVEVGAGDGHFASGVLQSLRKYLPDVFTATSYVIDEVSSHSRSIARRRLEPFADRVKFESLDDVEIDSGVVFSNELLDAFPVHRITVHDGQLQEFYVNVGANGNFEWQLRTPRTDLSRRVMKYFAECGIQLGEGQIAEIGFEIEDWLRNVAARMRTGFVVTIDYGAAAEELYSPVLRPRGTLRAFQQHRFVDDLLACPGQQDLTTTVNWSFVKSVGARLGFEVVEFQQQDKFLLAAGFLDQLEIELRESEDEVERVRISTAAREMILPHGMAADFQVLVQKKTSMPSRSPHVSKGLS